MVHTNPHSNNHFKSIPLQKRRPYNHYEQDKKRKAKPLHKATTIWVCKKLIDISLESSIHTCQTSTLELQVSRDENKSKVSTKVTTFKLVFTQEQPEVDDIFPNLIIWTRALDLQVKLIGIISPFVQARPLFKLNNVPRLI